MEKTILTSEQQSNLVSTNLGSILLSPDSGYTMHASYDENNIYISEPSGNYSVTTSYKMDPDFSIEENLMEIVRFLQEEYLQD